MITRRTVLQGIALTLCGYAALVTLLLAGGSHA